MSKFLWKVWLRPNMLTPDPTDYVAEVDTAGRTRTRQDIIDSIAAEGSEIHPETIAAIYDRINVAKRRFLQQGYGVFDDIVHLTPRVTGAWKGKETFSDGKHKVTVNAIPSKLLHEDFKHVGVEVLGVVESGARIMLVTDIATGRTDGAVTPNDDIIIAGSKIKIVGLPQPDGSPEPGIGVFFVSQDGASIPATRITENVRSKIIARVPSLTAGVYSLQIVTRYASGPRLLRKQRVITYNQPLIAI